MPVVALTQALVSGALTCPNNQKRIEYCDKECRGLLLEVRATKGSVPTWYVRYKQPKTRYERLGDVRSLSLAQARKDATRFKERIANGAASQERAGVAPACTLNEFVTQHVNPYNQERKRSHGRDLQLYVRIGRVFGQRKLSEISRKEVQSFHTDLVKTEKLAPATADHHVVYLRRILNLAVEWEYMEKNPLTNIPLLRVDNQIERYLSEDEVRRLIDVLQTDLASGASYILLFLLSTGARLNEAMQAKWEQIDVDRGMWRIPATNSKSKKARLVPLNESANWVLSQLRTKEKHAYLFVNEATQKPFVTITRAWYRLRDKAGISKLRIHDLRHSFASFLVNGGRSLYEVQQILGHSDPKVTMRYAHLNQDALRSAANAGSMIVPGRLLHRA